MNLIFTLISFLLLPNPATEKCGVKVLSSYSQNVLGKNIGYYVELENKSGKTIDAIQWTATFTNNFGDEKGVRKGEWSSGNFISPVEDGEKIIDLEGVWVEEATKISIQIDRIHFTDDSLCD